MTIRATSANIANVYARYGDMLAQNGATAGRGASASTASSTGDGSAAAAVSPLLNAEGRKQVSLALENMRKAGWESFTWDDIETYRKSLEAEFTAAIKSDLSEMGVDPNINFTLVADASGGIRVISDSQDKAAVEQYLQDNPEMAETFRHIQALSNLGRSRQNGAASGSAFAADLKTTLRAEAVEAFFAATTSGSGDYFSQIANFGSDSDSWFLGLNRKV